MPDDLRLPSEISTDLRSLAEFRTFCERMPAFLNQAAVDVRAQEIVAGQVFEPLTRTSIAPGQLRLEGKNYRESLSWGNLASRHRGVLSVIESVLPRFDRRLSQLAVYAPEAVTAFADRMRTITPGYVGSEYASDQPARARLKGVRIEDLMKLSFPSASFDLVCSNDVLEHVPSIDSALREMMRILRPGGVMVSTHPFAAGSDASMVRAEIKDGALVHHMPPEYHGNPVDPAGSLVFEVPGWDIVTRCRLAGASDAFVRILGSQRHGVVGANEGGVYMTVAIR